MKRNNAKKPEEGFDLSFDVKKNQVLFLDKDDEEDNEVVDKED